MTVTIEAVKDGQGSGNLMSILYHPDEQVFKAMVIHKIGKLHATTPVDLEPGFDPVLMMSRKIGGWLHDDEARVLFDLAKVSEGPIVELGSYMGKSIICLGWGSRLGAGYPVHSVDPHVGVPNPEYGKWESGSTGTFPHLIKAIQYADLGQIVTPHKMTSLQAVELFEDESLGLVYIDGDHDLATQDFDLWYPKVKSGGYILLHDSSSSGGWLNVIEALNTRILNSDACTYEGTTWSLSVGRKV